MFYIYLISAPQNYQVKSKRPSRLPKETCLLNIIWYHAWDPGAEKKTLGKNYGNPKYSTDCSS